MVRFTKVDVKHLFDDLQLYSGNIVKITDVHGPHPHNDGHIGGIIHTHMNTFYFTARPMFCDKDSWKIELVDPVESLRRGHSSIVMFTFPKIHRDRNLQKRYQVANLIYQAYNGYSNVSEANRLPEYERILGYQSLPTYQRVLEAIVRDFRSYQQRRDILLSACQRN